MKKNKLFKKNIDKWIRCWYDPKTNKIYEGIFYTNSDIKFYLIHKEEAIEITWIPNNFEYLGEL